MAGSLNIPFRCPNCGDSEKFASLHELRGHLESEHAYVTDRTRRRMTLSRLENCDKARFGCHSPLLELYHADAKKLEAELRKNKEEELNNKRRRSEYAECPPSRLNFSHHKRVGNIPPKASFREYGHCSKANKHLNSPKFSNFDNIKLRQHRYPAGYWSDGETEDDSCPVVGGKFAPMDDNTFERLHHETCHNMVSKPSSKVNYKDLDTKSPFANRSSDRHIGDTIASLSHEVMMERASQQATANSLYTAQEVLYSVEHAAEQRIAQQQQMIETFARELKGKERRLALVMREMESLRHQQSCNMENINMLRQKSDHENEHLQQELQRKQKELNALNQQLAEAQESLIKGSFHTFPEPVKLSRKENFDHNMSVPVNQNVYTAFLPAFGNPHKDVNNGNGHLTQPTTGPKEEQNDMETHKSVLQDERLGTDESLPKEEELRKIKRKAQQLERDRQNLLMEMQNLLEAASTDNDKLRSELENQSQKLSKLNFELEQSKHEQAELLGETNALYQQADVSLAKLKTMLKERDHQLGKMSSSLEEARTNQERLAKERDECIRLAEQRETVYKTMLSSNSIQVNTMKETLESSWEQKLKLEETLTALRQELAAKTEKDEQLADNVSRLKAKLADTEKSQAKMKEEVRRKEEKLKKAKHEMERMTTYLKNTAEKELEARGKLETFISGLIDRAGRAEAELKKLKSSYNSKSGAPKKHKKKDPALDLSSLPGVSAIAFPQDKSRKHGAQLSDEDATKYLEPPAWLMQNKNSRGYLHSTPKHSKQAALDSGFPVDRQDTETQVPKRERQSSPSMRRNEEHSNTDSKEGMYRTSIKYPEIQLSAQPQRPHLDMAYGEGASLVPSNSSHMNTSLAPFETSLIFENTPEVERMFQNVHRYAYARPPSQPEDMRERSRKNTLNQREEYKSRSLSVDDNGILWEHSPTYSLSSSRRHHDVHRNKGGQVAKHGRNDDTDIDEDLTDYIFEDEQQKSHEESEDADYMLSKSKKPYDTRITKAKMSELRKDPLPLGDKIAKLLTSLGPDAVNSTARQNYGSVPNPQNSQRPTLDSPKAANETPDRMKFHPSRAVNEYSTTESSDVSPLHKAKAVQMRLEQLTAEKNKLPKADSSSKQSDGFEMDTFNADSDFSSSSYASLANGATKPKVETKPDTDLADVSNVKFLEQNTPIITTSNENNPPPSDSKGKTQSTNETINATSNLKEPLAILPNDTGMVSPTGHDSETKDNDRLVKRQSGNTLQRTKTLQDQEVPVESSGVAEHVAEVTPPQCHIDPDLKQYEEAELKPAKELRARLVSPSDIHEASSEDDLLDGNATSPRKSPRRESIGTSTDGDLERLAMPGHLQKGFVVRKNVPTVKHIIRKKPRPKAMKMPSEESISSGGDDLDDEERTKRRAARRMRIALFRVFSYLDSNTLLMAACVNREWHRVSRHPALWRYVSLSDHSISSEFLITMSKWCIQTRTLSLQGLRGRDILAEESAEEYLQAIRGSLEPGLEKFLLSCQDTITSLHIRDCDNILTDKCLWLVGGYCRLLTTLTYQSSTDPVTAQLMWALGGGCPGITSLFVQPKHPCMKTNALNNRCLQLIGQFYQDIQELGLGGKEFDSGGLLPLVQSCQRLKSLYLDHCLVITSDLATTLCKAGLKHLQTLTIAGTSVEAKALNIFQGSCRQLKRVSISMNIQDCVEDPSKKKEKERYKKMVKALEALKGKLGFGIIFSLEAAPAE